MAKRSQNSVNPIWTLLLALIPIFSALFVWFSPLSFVPVPWPDDSAFYFVAKAFFHWPPRWVMLPQAPFEPSYLIFNFNTMPLYPILIGLGRFIGIEGSHLLKFWPLSSWALTGVLLGIILRRQGLPLLASILLVLTFASDPILRWASVLIRPESLIGLLGTALILGLTFGFPKKLARRGIWDPLAALLALAAYAHFNAIHLIYPVILSLLIAVPNTDLLSGIQFFWKALWAIGWRTLCYLSPWLLAVALHFDLFIKQLTLQWTRLNVPNAWLSSVPKMIEELSDSMGSPESWSPLLFWAGVAQWALIFLAGTLVAFALMQFSLRHSQHNTQDQAHRNNDPLLLKALLPSASWVLSSVWLWHTKPEVWFKYYIHLSLLCFVGVLGWGLWQFQKKSAKRLRGLWFAFLGTLLGIFLIVNGDQWIRMSQSTSWQWDTYSDFVDCVDQRLTEYEKNRPAQMATHPLQVWCPTFPDITIELSRRHPEWELSRTNDFWERRFVAIQHGQTVDAVVVTETLGRLEKTLTGKAEDFPETTSLWMNWTGYFLHSLWTMPGWKPNRFICQRGRWQAFIFLEKEPEKK